MITVESETDDDHDDQDLEDLTLAEIGRQIREFTTRAGHSREPP